MRVTPSRVRFVLEAAFLIIVAAICWAAHLTWKGIVPAMAVAWALVTLVERSAGTDRDEEEEPEQRFDAAEPAERPRAHETAPAAEQPPVPIPEPAPEPGPAPEPIPPAPEPSPPRPEPTPQPEPNPQLHAVPDLEPEPAPAPPRVAAPETTVTRLPQRDGAPREWNVWELERIARDREGEDATRDEELAFLLLELRQFANADGMLPPSFDPVIRETFGELLYAGI